MEEFNWKHLEALGLMSLNNERLAASYGPFVFAEIQGGPMGGSLEVTLSKTTGNKTEEVTITCPTFRQVCDLMYSEGYVHPMDDVFSAHYVGTVDSSVDDPRTFLDVNGKTTRFQPGYFTRSKCGELMEPLIKQDRNAHRDRWAMFTVLAEHDQLPPVSEFLEAIKSSERSADEIQWGPFIVSTERGWISIRCVENYKPLNDDAERKIVNVDVDEAYAFLRSHGCPHPKDPHPFSYPHPSSDSPVMKMLDRSVYLGQRYVVFGNVGWECIARDEFDAVEQFLEKWPFTGPEYVIAPGGKRLDYIGDGKQVHAFVPCDNPHEEPLLNLEAETESEADEIYKLIRKQGGSVVDWWAPEKCPLTGRSFQGWVEFQNSGEMVPVYKRDHVDGFFTIPETVIGCTVDCEVFCWKLLDGEWSKENVDVAQIAERFGLQVAQAEINTDVAEVSDSYFRFRDIEDLRTHLTETTKEWAVELKALDADVKGLRDKVSELERSMFWRGRC